MKCHDCHRRRRLDIAGYCGECATARRDACAHPPTRYYAWNAWDGRLCVACCECGAVLKGAA